MARNQKLSYKMNMNMFHFLTKQNYSKYSRISMSMSFSSSEASTMFRSSTASSTSESVTFSRGGVYFKIRDFRGAFIRGGVYSRRGIYSRKYGKCTFHFCKRTLCKIQRKSVEVPRKTVDTDF